MIELGKIQNLVVTGRSSLGATLNTTVQKSQEDILLPANQVPKSAKTGEEIEVFVYKDSEDRTAATTKTPRLTMGELALLKVVDSTRIGAFLDWGLEKDLFLPFREQLGKVNKGSSCLVGLYIDSSNRLCATMNIYNLLSSQSPYKENDRVRGTVYSLSKESGAYVAVDNKYQGLILKKELFGDFAVGASVEVRVTKVRADGKLELSPRQEAYNEIEGDAGKIMNRLKANGGVLQLNDDSSPDQIKAMLNMSKGAFKRAVGRLLKEGAIKFTAKGIESTWK